MASLKSCPQYLHQYNGFKAFIWIVEILWGNYTGVEPYSLNTQLRRVYLCTNINLEKKEKEQEFDSKADKNVKEVV